MINEMSKMSVKKNFTDQAYKSAVNSKVEITVLRRMKPSEIFETDPVEMKNPIGICEQFNDGQVFIVNEDLKRPEGFCSYAWFSLYPNIRLLAFGGDPPWYKEKGVAINCCIDGHRPVMFKLKRIEL
jgi:uncharacterized repeat protein (TIGR04076 family)